MFEHVNFSSIFKHVGLATKLHVQTNWRFTRLFEFGVESVVVLLLVCYRAHLVERLRKDLALSGDETGSRPEAIDRGSRSL